MNFVIKFVAGFILVWIVISEVTSMASHKPFSQCLESYKMDCE